MFLLDDCDTELEELRAEATWEARHRLELLHHPDCRDPDHPGCPACMEEDHEPPA